MPINSVPDPDSNGTDLTLAHPSTAAHAGIRVSSDDPTRSRRARRIAVYCAVLMWIAVNISGHNGSLAYQLLITAIPLGIAALALLVIPTRWWAPGSPARAQSPQQRRSLTLTKQIDYGIRNYQPLLWQVYFTGGLTYFSVTGHGAWRWVCAVCALAGVHGVTTQVWQLRRSRR